MLYDNTWRWEISAYYNDTVKPPKRPGELAMVTVHKSDSSRDTEMEIFVRRKDIGEVICRQLQYP